VHSFLDAPNADTQQHAMNIGMLDHRHRVVYLEAIATVSFAPERFLNLTVRLQSGLRAAEGID
jgi:hypothetical protein